MFTINFAICYMSSLCSVEMSKKGGYFRQTAQDVLIGLSVLTRYNNKMYRIDEILFDKNPLSTVDCQGEAMSYVDYYKKQYNIDTSKRCLLYHFLHLLCAEIIYSNPLFEVVNLLFGSV